MSAVVIDETSLDSVEHASAVVELLDCFAREPLILGRGLPQEVQLAIVPELRKRPGALVLLASEEGRAVALAICFEGFSTFSARSLLNIHDLYVCESHRGQGLGAKLIGVIEEEARQRNCCAITLEVRGDNLTAQRLYSRCGFTGTAAVSPSDAHGFWQKKLL